MPDPSRQYNQSQEWLNSGYDKGVLYLGYVGQFSKMLCSSFTRLKDIPTAEREKKLQELRTHILRP